MSGCGSGRVFLETDGELAIAPPQEAVKNARQGDTILSNLLKEDCDVNPTEQQ